MAKQVAIKIKGLKELQKVTKQYAEALGDMKDTHKRVGDLVLEAARSRMPHKSGDLIGSYKSSRIQSGAKVFSKLVYAGVSEFGGSIPRFHSKSKTLHKPKAPDKSYYIYPAIGDKRQEIERIYREDMARLAARYGLHE